MLVVVLVLVIVIVIDLHGTRTIDQVQCHSNVEYRILNVECRSSEFGIQRSGCSVLAVWDSLCALFTTSPGNSPRRKPGDRAGVPNSQCRRVGGPSVGKGSSAAKDPPGIECYAARRLRSSVRLPMPSRPSVPGSGIKFRSTAVSPPCWGGSPPSTYMNPLGPVTTPMLL